MGLICPKCAFEGKMHDLSEPYLAEEGWVQECPVHGRLYLWGHWMIEPAAVPGEGPAVTCLICDEEMEVLVLEEISYWQCTANPLHRLSLPEWGDLAGGKDVKDELRRAMEKRAELFMVQARAGNTKE